MREKSSAGLMRRPFDSLRFGPFDAEYHRTNVDSDFRDALCLFLGEALLPQVTIDFDDVKGDVVACYDRDRNCGENSAVRNLYRVRVAFGRGDRLEDVDCEVRFLPDEKRFETRSGQPLYLWTIARKEAHRAFQADVDALCRKIAREHLLSERCPCCGGNLRIVDLPRLFCVICSNACFKYDFHRDPQTGAFEHGHFFLSRPGVGKVPDAGSP